MAVRYYEMKKKRKTFLEKKNLKIKTIYIWNALPGTSMWWCTTFFFLPAVPVLVALECIDLLLGSLLGIGAVAAPETEPDMDAVMDADMDADMDPAIDPVSVISAPCCVVGSAVVAFVFTLSLSVVVAFSLDANSLVSTALVGTVWAFSLSASAVVFVSCS